MAASYPGLLPAQVHRKAASRYVPDPDNMTLMQQRFADEYIIDLDGEKAAIRAGWPPQDAKQASKAILKHAPVQGYIQTLVAERSKRTGVTQARVLETLGAMLNFDRRELFFANGKIKPPTEWTYFDQLMVAGFKVKKQMVTNPDDPEGPKIAEEITEVKITPMEALLPLAMRHLSMFNDKLTVEHTVVADRLREARLRRDGPVELEAKVIDADAIPDAELIDEPDVDLDFLMNGE